MNPNPEIGNAEMRLLSAIYKKTGGRSRGVRDVTELETGLSAEQAKAAWRDLLDHGLIERFSQDYAARLSPAGVDFCQSDRLVTNLESIPISAPRVSAEAPRTPLARKILIAHGRETGACDAVAKFVEAIDFQAIILYEPAELGRTIMEQVEMHDQIGFAVVLLTADDLGLTGVSGAELRPRMNVLMELGYFMGRLGRTKVCALAASGEMNLPADLAGVVLRSLDASGNWKSALSQELRAAGHRVDWS